MFRSVKSRKSNRTRLGVESLNSRIVPAVVLQHLDLDGDAQTDDIRIIGDFRASKVYLTDNSQNQIQVQIDANGDGDYADAILGDLNTAFSYSNNSFVVDARLGAGKDSLTYAGTSNWSGGERTISADLGSGNDEFTYIQNNDVFAHSHISLDVTGGYGNDTIAITHHEVRNSQVSLKVDAGFGSDVYNLKFDRIDDGSAVDIHTELGNGLNVHNADFEEIGFGDKAAVDMYVMGGVHKDTIKLNMHDDVGNGVTASRFSAVYDLFAGNDDFTALYDVGGNQFRVDDHSQASIVVRGGAGNDNILAGQNGLVGMIRIDPDALLSIDLDGGLGNDHIISSFALNDAFKNEGVIRIRMDGGFGIDTMSCFLANEASTNGVYDVAVRGGAGNDVMSFNLFNNGGAPTFGPAGGIILDGGLGVDKLTNGNPAVTKNVGVETVI